MKRFLNVGGNSKRLPVSEVYDGWEHVLLDIDPLGEPDIVCDARELRSLDVEPFDAIYCSHNLEHYYRHDVSKVLAGFFHVLKDDGFVDIRVPDIKAVLETVVTKKMELDDELYVSQAGPITAHDVIYGLGRQIEQSGEDFFAHKCGFTPDSLNKVVRGAGFPIAYTKVGDLEIRIIGFKSPPSDEAKALFSL